jgi:hypothetical protein
LDEAGVMAKRYGFSVALPRFFELDMAGIRGHGSVKIGVGTGGMGGATSLSMRKQTLDMALGVEFGPGR